MLDRLKAGAAQLPPGKYLSSLLCFSPCHLQGYSNSKIFVQQQMEMKVKGRVKSQKKLKIL